MARSSRNSPSIPTPLTAAQAAAMRSSLRGVRPENVSMASKMLTPGIASAPSLGQLQPDFTGWTAQEANEWTMQAAQAHMEIYKGDLGTTPEASAFQYWDAKEGGYDYNNNANVQMSPDDPAPLSLVPTSTTNPLRPRTVAAGYMVTDEGKNVGTLTVVFRDGTFYNYYEIPPHIWRDFRAVRSKGRYIRQVLDQYPRGYSSRLTSKKVSRQEVYRIARGHQMFVQRAFNRLQSDPIKPSAQNYMP